MRWGEPGVDRLAFPTAIGLYLRHPSSFEHETGAHPESPRRIAAIEEAMSERDWLGLEPVEARRATREELTRVHDEAHLRAIEELSARGGGPIDIDTVASEGSWEAAQRAAGAAAQAVDALLSDGERLAFCGLRPPGHHAERARAMGFCLFNNVAVAAAHALAAHGARRVLVVDWDVHHGNGTEAIFYGSDQVLYASVHQSPLYPGTGAPADVGVGAGEGYTINLPVGPGAGNAEFTSLVDRVVRPVALEWRPELVCVSAGFDAHRDDPLAQCEVDEAGFARMAASIRELSADLGAPTLVCLEGGYALRALAASVAATLEALGSPPAPTEPTPAEPAAEPRRRLAARWPVLGE